MKDRPAAHMRRLLQIGKEACMKTKSWLFRIIVAAVFVVAAGVIVFFAYLLVLSTEYKNTALEINDAILAYGNQAAIRQGDMEVQGSIAALDYYDRFLLNDKTQVYSRKSIEENDRTIAITLGPDRLSFTEGEDGWTTCILWATPGEQKSFRVRSQMTFMQLEANFQNYKRKN